jgi:hypothetical protein
VCPLLARCLYVSSGIGGDRIAEFDGDQIVIYDAHSLKKVKSELMEVPAGVFSKLRTRTVVVGLDNSSEK